MGSRGIDVPLSARRSAERAIQRLRQAEVVEWYRGLHKAIAAAEERARIACTGCPPPDGRNHYSAARIAARAILEGEAGRLAHPVGVTNSLPTTR